jgi:hypothetical protein
VITPTFDPEEHGRHVREREWHFITCVVCRELLDEALNSTSYNQYAIDGMSQGELAEAYLYYREKMSES